MRIISGLDRPNAFYHISEIMILVSPKFKNIINLTVFVTCWSRRPTNIISKVFIQIYKIKHTVLYLKYKQTIVVDVKPYLT